MDLKVERKEKCFTTSIYRKTTVTGLVSKFDLFFPMKYKENLIATLVNRACKLCSSFFKHLTLIEKQIHIVLNKLYVPFSKEIFPIQTAPKAVVYLLATS